MTEMDKIVSELKKINAKRILVQYPEGLITKIIEISKKLEDEGFEVLLSMEPCYGACDIRDLEARRLGCDAVLHIGHSDFGLEQEIPVIFWEYKLDVDPIPILEKEFQKLKPFKKVGLLTSIQYVDSLPKVKDYLEKNGKEVLIHKTLKYPGQILGCCVYSAEAIEDGVDCFLFVGSGFFHPLSVAIKVEKPTLSLDLERKKILDMEEEKRKWLRKRAWYESKIEEAKKIGIVVSWKKGQNRIEEALKLKDELENKGKEVHILAFDSFSKEKLEGLKIDALINMACPRIDEEVFI
ncbi:MAG: diphthamide biosynthesis enzyme Dph2 [Candidatus Aenigmatarchaeota archaeon]